MKRHKKEQEQYKEDLKKYDTDAYKLWEINFGYGWVDCSDTPAWDPHTKYRRKDQPFQPKYFSGLNWREAIPLIGEMVECSIDGDRWSGPFKLNKIDRDPEYLNKFKGGSCYYPYIRTCPETYAHPTVTINVNGKDWVLPKPETEAPESGADIYIFAPEIPSMIFSTSWHPNEMNENRLKHVGFHLTKDRAQAWADFWKEGILGAIKDN